MEPGKGVQLRGGWPAPFPSHSLTPPARRSERCHRGMGNITIGTKQHPPTSPSPHQAKWDRMALTPPSGGKQSSLGGALSSPQPMQKGGREVPPSDRWGSSEGRKRPVKNLPLNGEFISVSTSWASFPGGARALALCFTPPPWTPANGGSQTPFHTLPGYESLSSALCVCVDPHFLPLSRSLSLPSFQRLAGEQ